MFEVHALCAQTENSERPTRERTTHTKFSKNVQAETQRISSGWKWKKIGVTVAFSFKADRVSERHS